MANIRADVIGGDAAVQVYPSAARTSTPDTKEFEIGVARGIILVIDVTAFATAASLTVKVEGVDRVTGKTWLLLSGAELTGTGTTVLQVSPGLPVTTNASANALVPEVVRVTATHGNANSHTYAVGLHLCS